MELLHDGPTGATDSPNPVELTVRSSTIRFAPAAGDAPANKGRQYPAEPLTRAEASALVTACSAVSLTGKRNRALITVMWRSGLRLAEALALKPSDVDPAAGSIRVLRGKGAKARTVGADAGSMATVALWIAARRAAGITSGPLFCTLDGRELSQNYVRAMLGRMAEKAGIDKRVHPHGLRHTMAAELAAEGMPLNLISGQLGHSSSAVTSRYIDHVSSADVVAAMQRRQSAS